MIELTAVHPAYEGRGNVAKAARAVLAATFAGGLPPVVAVADPENVGSRRVAERIGMRYVGCCAPLTTRSPGSTRPPHPGA